MSASRIIAIQEKIQISARIRIQPLVRTSACPNRCNPTNVSLGAKQIYVIQSILLQTSALLQMILMNVRFHLAAQTPV